MNQAQEVERRRLRAALEAIVSYEIGDDDAYLDAIAIQRIAEDALTEGGADATR